LNEYGFNEKKASEAYTLYREYYDSKGIYENKPYDGIIEALKSIKETGKKLSDLASIMTELPQVLVNAKVKRENKDRYMEDKEIADMIAHLESKLQDKGRVLIRPSGTEPLVRVMLEVENHSEIKEDAKKLAKLIEEKMN
jgi:phosphoglucosamine mutase